MVECLTGDHKNGRVLGKMRVLKNTQVRPTHGLHFVMTKDKSLQNSSIKKSM